MRALSCVAEDLLASQEWGYSMELVSYSLINWPFESFSGSLGYGKRYVNRMGYGLCKTLQLVYRRVMSEYEGGTFQNEGKGRRIGLPKKLEGPTSHWWVKEKELHLTLQTSSWWRTRKKTSSHVYSQVSVAVTGRSLGQCFSSFLEAMLSCSSVLTGVAVVFQEMIVLWRGKSYDFISKKCSLKFPSTNRHSCVTIRHRNLIILAQVIVVSGSLPANPKDYLKSGDGRFLQHPFQFALNFPTLMRDNESVRQAINNRPQ